jgi:hypothetical protein
MGVAEERFGLSADVDYQYYRREAGEQEVRLYESGLHVDGDLTCFCGEGIGYFCLVTGDIQERNVLLSGFPHVVARGDLVAANGILGQKGDDGGFLSVGGDTAAR